MRNVLVWSLMVTAAVHAQEGPSENLALGKPYTLEPAPAYQHCTDPADATQLTDGFYSEGYFWTQPSTVGWQNAKPIVIVIDLGQVQPVRGISLNTAAGAAQVEWPAAIDVLVADEPGQYHAVGNLVALDAPHGVPDPDTYATHRYWTDSLRTHGRYVAFVIAAQPFFFCDEIEIYAGEPAWVNEPLTGPIVADLRDQFVKSLVETCIRRRMREDALALRDRPSASTAELDALAKEAEMASLSVGDDFRAVLPLNDLHARILAAQAERWRAIGLAPLTVWTSSLWDALPHLADPDTGRPAGVEVWCMQNEYRAGAFNLSNASDKLMTLEIRFEGLPGNPAEYIRVREVAWTDTSGGVPVAAALPDASRQGDAWIVTVPSGMTRQVWLTFHPVSVEAGTHRGVIRVTGEGVSAEVPVSLQVYPLRFPDRPTLHFGGWDYTDSQSQYQVTPENRAALVTLLQEYWVDSPWGTGAVLPFGEHDSSGSMTAPPDTANFDAWVALWPEARQYLVFPAVGGSAHGFAAGSPEFDRAVGAWATFWAEHARSKGIEPEEVGLLLVDEPSELEPQVLIVQWAKAIRAANTGLRIWEDPVYHDLSKASPEMLAVSNALCPNRPLFLNAAEGYRDFFAAQRDADTTLELYSCSGPVRRLDPYSYHRLQAWTCFRYGATASYFWAFGDAGGGSCWNEYASERASYTPLFLDATSVTTGKHLEACREGIEDYEYLVMLRQAADKARADGEDVSDVEKLLQELPAKVDEAGRHPSFAWNDPLDRTIADQARKQVLEALVDLAQ